MKRIIIALGMLSALCITALAQEDAPKPPRPERPDPETVAKRMVTDFDKDGNHTLNKAELGEAMMAMRANRGPRRPDARPRAPQGQRPKVDRPQQRQRPQAENRGPRTERPERPDRPDMAEMFLKRNDSNEDGELTVEELSGGLAQMNRARGGPNRDRPQREEK